MNNSKKGILIDSLINKYFLDSPFRSNTDKELSILVQRLIALNWFRSLSSKFLDDLQTTSLLVGIKACAETNEPEKLEKIVANLIDSDLGYNLFVLSTTATFQALMKTEESIQPEQNARQNI